MSKHGLEPKWRCDECFEVHDSEEAARDCCQPMVSAGYLCPVCRDFLHSEDAAADCCGGDAELTPPFPSAAELEAAGQCG